MSLVFEVLRGVELSISAGGRSLTPPERARIAKKEIYYPEYIV